MDQIAQSTTKKSFMKVDFPLLIINSVVNEDHQDKEDGDETFIIPPGLFEITKVIYWNTLLWSQWNQIQ